jgi:hypothetical protein
MTSGEARLTGVSCGELPLTALARKGKAPGCSSSCDRRGKLFIELVESRTSNLNQLKPFTYFLDFVRV